MAPQYRLDDFFSSSQYWGTTYLSLGSILLLLGTTTSYRAQGKTLGVTRREESISEVKNKEILQETLKKKHSFWTKKYNFWSKKQRFGTKKHSFGTKNTGSAIKKQSSWTKKKKFEEQKIFWCQKNDLWREINSKSNCRWKQCLCNQKSICKRQHKYGAREIDILRIKNSKKLFKQKNSSKNNVSAKNQSKRSTNRVLNEQIGFYNPKIIFPQKNQRGKMEKSGCKLST